MSSSGPPAGDVTGGAAGAAKDTTYEVKVNHTLLYKLGLFILSLLLVIALAINLSTYNDISDGSGNDGISIDTANNYAGITRIAMAFACIYFIYRSIILITDPVFKTTFAEKAKSFKEGVGQLKKGLGEFTPSVNLSKLSDIFSSSDKSTGFDRVVMIGGIPQIN